LAAGAPRLDRRSDGPALFLNQRDQRLSARGAHDAITGIAAGAGLHGHVTNHVFRHPVATTRVRGGTDVIVAAELLVHARLETTRVYNRPNAEDRRQKSKTSPKGTPPLIAPTSSRWCPVSARTARAPISVSATEDTVCAGTDSDRRELRPTKSVPGRTNIKGAGNAR
jgi:Phage integrase family